MRTIALKSFFESRLQIVENSFAHGARNSGHFSANIGLQLSNCGQIIVVDSTFNVSPQEKVK